MTEKSVSVGLLQASALLIKVPHRQDDHVFNISWRWNCQWDANVGNGPLWSTPQECSSSFPPTFQYIQCFASPPSYGNNNYCAPLTRRSVPSQFSRIGSEEVMQSINEQGPILGPTRTLLEDESFQL